MIQQQQKAYSSSAAAASANKKATTTTTDEGQTTNRGKRKWSKPSAKIKAGEDPTKQVENPNDLYIEGIPEDMELSELTDYFSQRVGMLRRDEETGAVKAKMYKSKDGQPKGDALLCFYKKESVDMAIAYFDDVEIRDGHRLKLSVAKFTPTTKKKKPAKKKHKKLIDQTKELGWDEDERVHIVIHPLFDPKESYGDENYFNDLKAELTEEFEKFGEVEKVTIFEHNPKGYVVVKYKDNIAASMCVQKMNGRFFAKNKLEADFYDGISDYYVAESEESKAARAKAWEAFLEGE
eukprot:TRINITY_DN6056_c0_g1_i1.p1 TRINITY_DN6056_c0_g1~~TRINITY_DN6056_c0_g1_i1.p1  ORF type:complete len:293 (+),score=94.41 TRINITY_DN6056_c0_g1_i1:264-1142(+)